MRLGTGEKRLLARALRSSGNSHFPPSWRGQGGGWGAQFGEERFGMPRMPRTASRLYRVGLQNVAHSADQRWSVPSTGQADRLGVATAALPDLPAHARTGATMGRASST